MMNKFNNTFSISLLALLLFIRITSYKTFSLQKKETHSLRKTHNNDSVEVHTIWIQFQTYAKVIDR